MSDPADIRNFLRLSDRVTTSGKLDPADPARLAAMGARRVINLAMPDHPEMLPDAAGAMAQAGLEYVSVPVPFDSPGEDHYRRFSEEMAAAGEEPGHVHCVMNWRVSAFMYRWNREHGMDEATARAQMEAIWSPESNGHPDAPKWAAFVRGER
ncbi:protein tyrosine phosphatase family protein [Tsuneonella sp. HG222]